MCKEGAFSITERLWGTAAIWQWEGQVSCSAWDNPTKGRIVVASMPTACLLKTVCNLLHLLSLKQYMIFCKDPKL